MNKFVPLKITETDFTRDRPLCRGNEVEVISAANFFPGARILIRNLISRILMHLILTSWVIIPWILNCRMLFSWILTSWILIPRIVKSWTLISRNSIPRILIS